MTRARPRRSRDEDARGQASVWLGARASAPCTAARSGALALKPDTVLAGIESGCRVCELTPWRAWWRRSSNVPNGVSVTFSPRCSVSTIRATAASSAYLAALRDTPARSATASIKSRFRIAPAFLALFRGDQGGAGHHCLARLSTRPRRAPHPRGGPRPRRDSAPAPARRSAAPRPRCGSPHGRPAAAPPQCPGGASSPGSR